MLKFCVQCVALIVVSLFGSMLAEAYAKPLGASRMSGATAPTIEIKLKCGLTNDGRFVCANTNKKKNKCSGPNDCGPGYRDLEKPNKYGACCEETKDGAKGEKPKEEEAKKNEPQQPNSGGCRQVERTNQMNCKPPFDAISCSAVENGTMTCCCVK